MTRKIRLDEIRARADRGYVYVPMSDVTEAAIDDVAYLLRELDARTAERDAAYAAGVAVERERCAKLCEERAAMWRDSAADSPRHADVAEEWEDEALECAAAIREGGEK